MDGEKLDFYILYLFFQLLVDLSIYQSLSNSGIIWKMNHQYHFD